MAQARKQKPKMTSKTLTQTTISTQNYGRFEACIKRVWFNGSISYTWEVLDTKFNIPYQESGFLTSAGARQERQKFLSKVEGLA